MPPEQLVKNGCVRKQCVPLDNGFIKIFFDIDIQLKIMLKDFGIFNGQSENPVSVIIRNNKL